MAVNVLIWKSWSILEHCKPELVPK